MADHRPKNQSESIDITGQFLGVGFFFRHSGGGRNPVLAGVRDLTWMPAFTGMTFNLRAVDPRGIDRPFYCYA
jgi:hypothetical protein